MTGNEIRSLDRALAGARTPQVPAGLAARIISEVTELPQQSPAEVATPPIEVGRRNPRWKRAATAAALVLVVGAATLVLRGGGAETEQREQLAVTQEIAPASTPATELAVAPERLTLAAMTKAPKHEPAAEGHNASAPSAPDATELAVAPALAPEPATTVAQQDVARPVTTVVEPLPASTPIYGPSAPPQGLGISGGNVANMPRSGPGGGAAPGGLGGPPRR